MPNMPQKYLDFDISNMDMPFGDFRFPSMNFPAMSTHAPEISIWEEDKNVVVEVATPGVKPEDVEMTVEKGILLIRAHRKEEKTDKSKKYYQKSSSSFVYRISIPHEIDEKCEPKATLKDGMLQVHFKKSEHKSPKKINVQSSK